MKWQPKPSLFVAGFETSFTTMSFVFYELAYRTEIKEVLKRHNNQITYDALIGMSYLDKVVNGKPKRNLISKAL